MEKAQSRVQDAINDMVNTLDRKHIRKMQAKMYHCSAACCENSTYSMEEVQNCIEHCGHPVTSTQNYFQQELGNFQNRLQRCAMDCQDKVRDKAGPGATEADMPKYRGEMERCVVRCADTHIALIPTMMERMNEVLNKQQ